MRIDLLADETLHLAQLLDHVGAGVFELQLHAITLGIGLGLLVHVFAQVSQEGVIEGGHGHANLEVGG